MGTYVVTAVAVGSRELRLKADGSVLELPVASPPEFGGPAGFWSPEHLLAGALASCWLTTFQVIAELSRLSVASITLEVKAEVERAEDRKYWVPRFHLYPRVEVQEAERERALRAMAKAKEACLVGRSLRSEIVFEPQVSVLPGAAASEAAPAPGS